MDGALGSAKRAHPFGNVEDEVDASRGYDCRGCRQPELSDQFRVNIIWMHEQGDDTWSLLYT